MVIFHSSVLNLKFPCGIIMFQYFQRPVRVKVHILQEMEISIGKTVND